jgi:hypothetical protein
MAIDFPASPTNGQTVTVGGVTWTWDGVKWVAQGTGVGVYLPLTGGTMTGDLILNRDAQVALGAATKQQADAAAGGNRIINGDMRIDQRNNGASGTAAGYTIDRWGYGALQPNKGTWARGSSGPAIAALGFPYYLSFVSSSAYTPLVTDQFNFSQLIEADMVSDFAWGTANAQPVTLSFWAFSSLTGTFSGAIRNYPVPSTRSYPFSFSLPSANTWTKIVITIPGDTAGTWVMQGNAAAFGLVFDLGCGANFRGPANAWAAANYVSATGAQSIVATNGATFYVTGVKLEIGSVATPFNRQSMAQSLIDCQRYYQFLPRLMVMGNVPASGVAYEAYALPVAMRATPTAAITNTTFSNSSAFATESLGSSVIDLQITVTATGVGWATGSVALIAEL